MRKINKTCHLSTKYKTWEEGLEANGTAHPVYNSSNGEYYWDIAMNLFNCQSGLCAYTEMRICAPRYFAANNWNDERVYVNPDAPANPQIAGQLEHFDRSLKTKDANNKAWLWSNLFMAETNVNTKVKLINEVDNILKPDEAGYDEFELLEYNSSLNLFIANTDLSIAKQLRVNKMIKTLGLNFDPIKEQRRIFLESKIKLIDFNVEGWETIVIEQFITAFEMIKRERNPVIV